MSRIYTLTFFFLILFSTSSYSQFWCCCQTGCSQDIFFIGCDAWCAGFGGGTNYGSNNGYPDLTCGGLSCPPAVPIELSYFKGDLLDDGNIMLQWRTETEVNNQGFEIYRSNNLESWEKIMFLDGQGTTEEAIDYQFVDSFPMYGINYYFLKQIDYDGKSKISDIIRIENHRSDNYIGELYPNPSHTGLLNLQYYSTKDDLLHIVVMDISGNFFISQKYSISHGGNLLSFDFSTLSRGVFIVKIMNASVQVNRRLIIQ